MQADDKENTACAKPLATVEADVALMPESYTFQRYNEALRKKTAKAILVLGLTDYYGKKAWR
jgi:hypothetical protein